MSESNNFYLIPMPIQFSFKYLCLFMFCILMSVIAQLYLIPLISGRHGRPATKLPVRKIIKNFSSKLNVLQLESRTFCVVTSTYNVPRC